MTQLELARERTISPQMSLVAENEGVEAEFIRRGVAEGTIVIPANIKHTNLTPCGRHRSGAQDQGQRQYRYLF
jgi:phosphomethylpyrimidine synthase